jgi:acylglycerol lipase
VNHATGTLDGVGGRQIFRQSWHAGDAVDEAPRGVVVIVHGAGEHSGRYEHVAARLVAEGYAVHALDHRGHGRSDGPRALIDRMDHAAADLDQLVVAAGAEHPGLPIFILGHSMGATISLRFMLSHQDRVAGMILSGALASVQASAALRAIGHAMSAVAPRLPLIAIDPSLISRHPAVVAAYQADPLVHHGKLPARTAAEIADTVDAFPADVPRITTPTLIAFGTADALCPPKGSAMLGERIGSSDITVRPYEGLYHEILNEPEQRTVLDGICGWLNAHLTPVAASTASR